MTPEDCKRVQEWLGDIHKRVGNIYHPFLCSCGEEFWNDDYLDRHLFMMVKSFRTPDDYFACVRRLEELGQLYGLDSFLDWADSKWTFLPTDDPNYEGNFIQWLHSRTDTGHMMLCWLVAKWLEER